MSIYADEGTAAHQVLEECLIMEYEITGAPMDAHLFIGSTRTITDGPHGRTSPSGAKRWMTCPGAPSMEEQFPEKSQGPRDVEVTIDMTTAVQTALDYVRSRVEEMLETYAVFRPTVTVTAERRVSLLDALGTEECDGTSDITIIARHHEGRILAVEQADYKHGVGVPVSVDDPQNEFYLLGVLLAEKVPEDDAPRCWVTIIQPRCDKVSPRIRRREIADPAWRRDFIDRARAALGAVGAADSETRPEHLVASEDGCRFCNAKGACAEYTRFAMTVAGVIDNTLPDTEVRVLSASEDYARTDPRFLDADVLCGILKAKDILIGALQATEDYVLKVLEDGTAAPVIKNRFKLVHKRTRRKWGIKDPAELERRLKKLKGVDPKTGKLRALGKKDLYVTKLDTIAGVERTLKTMTADKVVMDALKQVTTRPEGALTVAPVSDPRPAANPPATAAFGSGPPPTTKPEEVTT